MNLIKPRVESKELRLLRGLHLRMKLSEKDVNYYRNLEKGFEGEVKFDTLLEKFSDDWLVLNDLLFECNNTMFQIDSLLMSCNKIYLFDVKNYEGDYVIGDNRWCNLLGSEIKDPLLQLNRCESLLRRLLQDLGINFSIEAYLIFINPQFYLYQAPTNLPIIFLAQLERFINSLKKRSSKLKEKHLKIAEQLLTLHLNKSPFMRIPDYQYDQLKKGIACLSCRSLDTDASGRILICRKCGQTEKIYTAVLRSVKEFKFLFPDNKITTNTIHDWCNGIVHKKTIWRVLSLNFKSAGHGPSSHFI